MEVLFLIGRLILGVYFLYNGVNHFRMRQMMVGYAQSQGVPAPGLGVPVTGLMLLFGGASLALGALLPIGAVVLIVFLVPTAFWMHKYWGIADPMMAANQRAHFQKNIALAAALLIILSLHGLLTTEAPFSLLP